MTENNIKYIHEEEMNAIKELNEKTDKIAEYLEGTRMKDILQNYANPWRIIKLNILVGLARGVGLTLGTALFLGLLFLILRNFVNLPVIGEYIAQLLKWVDTYRNIRR